MGNFWKSAKKFIKSNIDNTSDILKLSEMKFDHVSYQTRSSDEYLRVLKELEGKTSRITEFNHAGRRITLLKIIEPLEVYELKIDVLEICEPKPKRIVESNDFNHVAFVSADFDGSVNELNGKGFSPELKEIAGHKLAKVENERFKIEIRNKSILSEFFKDIGDEQQVSVENHEVLNLRKQLETEKNLRLLALADYQNLQKRVFAENERATSKALSGILKNILDILDDFKRSIEHYSAKSVETDGIALIYNKLKSLVTDLGIIEIEPKQGDVFDPNLHEAIGVISVGEDKNNTVAQVAQNGYSNQKTGEIIKPSKVIVGKFS